ncbi:MAG: hypothetical protein NTV61_01600 [Candidatus Bathyarchaeota archaeon]|nr:hypothetical protein [Candidatus Bathyarchaeota archaeon]
MADEKADIVLFRIPLCGKCKQVMANLAQVKKDRPSLRVRIYTFPDHIGLAQRHGLLTVPALLIRGKPYRGILSTGEILAALDAPA